MPKPSVAVILVNWNGYADTLRCITSLKQCTYSTFSVVVVDNGSSDGSIEKLTVEFPEVHFIQNSENEGFTGGCNKGMNFALQNGFQYICLLNNDTEVEPPFLEILVAALESSNDAAAIQPRIFYNHDRTLIWNAGGIYYPFLGIAKTRKDKPLSDKTEEIDWITGCCFLIRAEAVRVAGMLNNHYFAYFEDVDWSLRLRNLGYSLLYCPQAVIYHDAGSSSKTKKRGREGFVSPFVHYLNVRNHLFLVRQHTPLLFVPTVALWQLVTILAYILYFILRLRFAKLKAILKGLHDGLSKDITSVV